MDKELRTAIVGLLGALIGGGLAFHGSYYALSQQQEAESQLRIAELQDVALALYFDISKIEKEYNNTMYIFSSNAEMSDLDIPDFIYWTDNRFFSSDWIYNIFGKDISEFDNIISIELYDFYKNDAEINGYSRFIYQINQAYRAGEKISPFDKALAHLYTKALFEVKLPEGILLAEKIKRNLRQKYNVNINLIPMNLTGSNNRIKEVSYGSINATSNMTWIYS
jgi:hypothetical protein